MQSRCAQKRRGQCPFPSHDLSMPQVISILSATLARCDAHSALLARATSRTTGFLFGSQECQPCTSRPVLESLSHLRCAPDASRRSLTLILGIWLHVHPHVHLFPCFSKVHVLRSERASATARKYTRNSLPLARAANVPQPFSTCYGLKGPTGSGCNGKLSQPQPLQGELVFSPCLKRKL